jgi:protein-disulfide isomerase
MRALLVMVTMSTLGFSGTVKPLTEGNPDSLVRVIVYEDLQCPDCAVFREMLDKQVLPKYGAKAAFEHRDFPLPKHKWARQAAIASRYFQTVKPELALEWRRYAMANLREITPETFKDKLSAWAKAHNQNPATALAALDDKTLAAAVEEDYQDGIARGIAHTPTVLVNGEPFIETFTFEQISQGLDKAISGQ